MPSQKRNVPMANNSKVKSSLKFRISSEKVATTATIITIMAITITVIRLIKWKWWKA